MLSFCYLMEKWCHEKRILLVSESFSREIYEWLTGGLKPCPYWNGWDTKDEYKGVASLVRKSERRIRIWLLHSLLNISWLSIKKVLQRRNTSSTFTATLLERNNYYNNISVFIGITITLEVNRKSKPLMKFH